jgi:hypothetical protein
LVNYYTSFLYKDSDNWYVLESGDGEILGQNQTTPETLLQTGLDRKGTFKIKGDISCSTGLTTQGGLKLKSDTLLDFGPETWIRVPQGYATDLFVFDYTYQNATIWNVGVNGILNVNEQGTPQKQWSAIGCLLKDPGSPASKGICLNDFGNIFVNNARNAIRLDLQHSGGWITSTNFKRFKIFTSVNGIEFVNSAGISSGVPGISSNTFEHIWLQSGGSTEYGVKNVMGKNLWFKDVSIWDLQNSYDDGDPDTDLGDGHSASFSPYCSQIFVEGGIMMYYNLENNAPKGTVHWIDAHDDVANWEYYIEPTIYETNGSLTGGRVYTINHGLGYQPDWIDVIPKSEDALISPIKWDWNSTEITITYQGTPPPPATAGNQNNIKFAWRASIK